jgi:hypothetical protein
MCYFCNVPVHGREFIVKQRKAVELFLQLNPQWLAFGKVFDEHARLCNQGYCLAAHFDSWRVDYFGVNSPRGARSPRARAQQKMQDMNAAELAESLVAAADAAAATADDDNKPPPNDEDESEESGKVEDLLRRTGASLASSLVIGDEEGLAADGVPIINAPGASSSKATAALSSKSAAEEEDERFDATMRERQHALGAIKDRTSDLDQSSNALSDQLRKNREERLKVARRLAEMREQQPELELRKLERQKDLIIERKRELFESMLQARIEKEEAQKKVDRLDLEQRITMMKSEEYSRRRKEDEAMVEERLKSRSRLKEDLEPAMKHLAHVPDAQDIIDRGLAGGADEQNSVAITQELQHALREAYTHRKEELLEERKRLTAGRFEIEARLGQLKDVEKKAEDSSSGGANGELKTADNDSDSDDDDIGDIPLKNDHDNTLKDDEPFEAAYALADSMKDIARDNTEMLMQRMARNRREGEWLDDYPETGVWREVTARAQQDRDDQTKREEMNAGLHKYFEVDDIKASHVEDEKRFQAYDAAVVSVGSALLWEVCEGLVRRFHFDAKNTHAKITNVLDQTIIDVLYGTGPNEREFIRVTGREYLAHGLLNDYRRVGYKENVDSRAGQALFKVDVSQENCMTSLVDRSFGMGYSWNRLPQPKLEWELPSDGVRILFYCSSYLSCFVMSLSLSYPSVVACLHYLIRNDI